MFLVSADAASANTWLSLVAVPIAAYVVGSIPTGAVVARLYGNVDLTKVGSGRTGATNVTRLLGPAAGIIVLLGDFAKGGVCVWAAQQVADPLFGPALAGFFSVLGHTRSVFLRGRGGRGIATGLGGLAFSATIIFLPACLFGCLVAGATRYVSLGSICGCLTAMVVSIVLYATGQLLWPMLTYVLAAGALVVLEHRDNVARLVNGTERKLGER